MQRIPITLSRWLVMAVLLPVILATVEKGYGQCLGGWKYPEVGTFSPSCTGSAEIIVEDGFTYEYSDVEVSTGQTYTFASSRSTDYLTIANASGTTAYIHGTTPVTWTATISGTIRMYLHSSATCGTETGPRVRSVACGTPPPAPVNDDADGATLLAVSSGCTGAPYANVDATDGSPEPYATIANASFRTVWFKFVAPASGVVKVSTDYEGGTLENTLIALFSATDSSDYSTFTEIAADDNNGITGDSTMSILYATGLTPRNTYYVQVGKYSVLNNDGSFCLTVDSLTDGMLTDAHTCDDLVEEPSVQPYGTFSGQLSIVDNEGRLMAIVKNNVDGAVVGDYYDIGLNINADPEVGENGTLYMARSFAIANDISSGAEVQIFFLASELEALQAADSSITLENLQVTKFDGGCDDFDGATGTLITPTATGSVGNVRWITFEVTSFSKFFIHGGDQPLPVRLLSFEGNTEIGGNRLNWQTAADEKFSHYELERSTDGKLFSSIANIASGVSQAGYYNYLDQSPLTGANFYRLKMVDIDGRFKRSDIVKLENSLPSEAVQVYPNPAHQYISVTGTEGRAHITMTNLAGQVVKSKTTGSVTTQVDVSELPAGIYHLRYVNGTEIKVFKVSVQ